MPPPLLAPFTACPGGKELIVRACDVYDSRANEVAVVEYIQKLQDGSSRLNDANTDPERETFVTELGEGRKRQ